MKLEDAISLIHKDLLEVTTSEEQLLLNQWIVESTENQDIVDKTKLVWRLSQSKKNDYEPDVDKGLSRLKNRIQEDKGAKRIQMRPNRLSLWKYVAAAAILLIFGLYWFNSAPQTATTMVQLATIEGEKSVIELNDGTKVFLNENSELSYPDQFGNERVVNLKGEAFFEVAKDAAHPFIIKTSSSKVTVLGTSFNVRSYLDEKETTVSVRSGKVRFEPNNSQQNWDLTANEKVRYDFENQRFNKDTDESANDWSWHSGQLVFRNQLLKEVIPALEKHYDVKVSLTNTDILKCRTYTGSFKTDEVANVLEAITVALNLRIKQTAEASYILAGGECK